MDGLIDKRGSRITTMVMIIPGIVLLALAVWQFLDARSFVGDGVSTEGTVVALETVRGNEGVSFSPVFQFTDGNGERHRKVSSTADYPAKYDVGDPVDVIYQPGDPQDARIYSFFSIWGAATILGAVGGLFLFAGIVGPLLFSWIGRTMLRSFSRRI